MYEKEIIKGRESTHQEASSLIYNKKYPPENQGGFLTTSVEFSKPLSISVFNYGVSDTTPIQRQFNCLDEFEYFFERTVPVVDKNEHKHLFSMATFKPGTTRKTENVESIAGIVLDFDNKEPGWHSIEEILQRVKDLGLVYISYTTWSHRPDHPRWRLILIFNEPVQPAQWRGIYKRTLALLGHPRGIDEAASKDMARIWFMPCHSPYTPCEINCRLEGKLLNISTLPELTQMQEYQEENQGELLTFKQSETSPQTYPKWTKENMRNLLRFIDPDESFDEWLKTGAALHHEFESEGFLIWDAHSRKGQKYKGIQDLHTHWKTFRDKPNNVTVGTLVLKAKQNGWKPEYTRPVRPISYFSENNSIIDETPWPNPSPIKSELLPVDSFDEKLMPETLQAYVNDCSFRMQCPPDYIGVPIINMIGSLIGAACGIKPKQHDNWTVIPNLWGGLIGTPSKLKTPAIEQAYAPLKEIEKRAIEQYETELEEWGVKNEIARINEEAFKTEIKKKLKKKEIVTEEAEAIYTSEVKKVPRPSCVRYRTNDGTIEKIHELISKNPRGLLLHRDELVGLMLSCEREGHETDRAFYLEGWNGYGSYTVDRIGRGTVHVDNLCLSIFGSTQPDKITHYIQRSVHAFENDGLLQRFQLLVYPDPPQRWEYVDKKPNQEAKEAFYRIAYVIADPNFFKGLRQGGGEEKRLCFNFNAEAQATFIEWFTELEQKLRTFEEPIIEQHLAKYRKLMPALALIFHVIDIAEGTTRSLNIPRKSALRAMAWCDYLESHARRIYDMALNVTTQAASVLSKRIEQGKLERVFSIRDITRKGWSVIGKDTELAKAACEELIKANWVAEQTTPATKADKGKTEYVINPRIKISKKEEFIDE